MNYLFWTCWSIELLLVIWWIGTDMMQSYLKFNPYAPMALLYLGVVLLVRFGMGAERLSSTMILVPAIPLVGLLAIIMVYQFHKQRAN